MQSQLLALQAANAVGEVYVTFRAEGATSDTNAVHQMAEQAAAASEGAITSVKFEKKHL